MGSAVKQVTCYERTRQGEGAETKSPGLRGASGDDPGMVGIHADLKAWAGALLIAETQA